jgi:hypothetical protein
MRKSRYAALAGTLTAGLLALGTAHADFAVFSADLSGPGNGDGTGSVTLDSDARTVCYELKVALDPPATAAHIHRGYVGTNGPIVVPLDAPSSGSSSGCREGVEAALIVEMVGNPSGFYVNVHNAAFSNGAIRGQFRP